MTKRVKNAIDVLLDAINNRTLAKGTCTACAVGNLVAAGIGGKVIRDDKNDFFCDKNNTTWSILFSTSFGNQIFRPDVLNDETYGDLIKSTIKTTEFSIEELKKIEYTFETNTKIYYSEMGRFSDEEILQDQIRGLEAVVKVMMEFDNIKEDVKEVFTNKVELVG